MVWDLVSEFCDRNYLTISLSVFLSIVVIFLLSAKTRFTRTARLVNKFPGDVMVPVFGNFFQFCFAKPDELVVIVSEYVNKHGRTCRGWFFQKPVMIVAENSVVEKIMLSHDNIDRNLFIAEAKVYLGEGLITSEGAKWKADRKQLNAGMKLSLFKEFVPVFNKHAENLTKQLLKDVFPVNHSCNSFKDLTPFLRNCTSSMLSETILGNREQRADKLNDSNLLKCMKAVCDGMTMRITKPYLCLPGLWNIFGNGKMETKYFKPMQKEVLAHVIKSQQNIKLKDGTQEEITDDIPVKTFMEILLDPKNPREAQDIADHVITMLGAGTETTAWSMSYTLYLLALNPMYQVIVQNELDNIFLDRADKSVKYSDLAEMKYLEMCIKESMRLYPTVPVIPKISNDDIVLDNGLVIPRGCDIIIPFYELHRDPTVFPDPEKFLPERFSSVASSKIPTYAYMPFSIGSRNCIGQKYAMMKMKVVLAHLLRQFEISTLTPRESLKLVYGIVMESEGGLPLCLDNRKC